MDFTFKMAGLGGLLFGFFLGKALAQNAELPPGFAQAAVAEGLNPTAMALAPDGRIFLAQKDGRVLVYHTGEGELHAASFIQLDTDDFNEKGLNGIALHPKFDDHPWVYLYYTPANTGHNRISRVWAHGDFALPGSEQVLLELEPLDGSIHNGGAMVFGPDGNLYVGVGDGAKPDNAQNLGSLLGKILRLHPDGSIPADNPFNDQLSGDFRAIYAYGVRNPFSMATDPASGRIFFCDVGAEAWEEVNALNPGANYGWKLAQGPSANPAHTNPVWAYTHASGCAVVGAAFGFSGHNQVPSTFRGAFFCADYCAGWVRALDPATGQLTDTLVRGADRSVSLLAGPNGDLYYLARAGLGGGSPLDNTASTEGVLWRVFWIGEGPPQFTRQPQPALVAEGEPAFFRADAFGSPTISYQWFRDSLPVPGADAPVWSTPALSLADSGAAVFCVATNSFGADTSAIAPLGVSANRRPEPQILLPLAGAHYRAGDTLVFAGAATDAEDGPLNPAQLSWRIDFFHASHNHPALPAVPGISAGAFVTPTVGETATDVFYRIELRARDQAGFEKSVFRDVTPIKTQISVAGPSGVALNADGQLRPLPAVFESVVGMQRHLEAPLQQQIGDTIFVFREWAGRQTAPLLTFQAPDTAVQLETLYDQLVLGNGTGLLGHYFFDPEGDFDAEPVLSRIDSSVQFLWNGAAPDSLLPADFFTVRWMGFVQPLFTETYAFSVRSDDGCRLWVNDQLLIDQWAPQALTEHAGSIALDAGKKYRIRLEYQELAGGASAELFWSSARQARQIVPRRQLYPPNFTRPATVSGVVGLDTNHDGVWTSGEASFAGAEVRIFLAGRDSLFAETRTLAGGRFTFWDLPADSFYLHVALPPTGDVLLPVQNVDASGKTGVFSVLEGAFQLLDVAWEVNQVALGGTVWLDENRNGQIDAGEPFLPKVTVLVYKTYANLVAAQQTDAEGGYGIPLLGPGAYFLVLLAQSTGLPLLPGFGLNALGETPVFFIGQGDYQVRNLAFVPDSSASATVAQPAQLLKMYPNPAVDQVFVDLPADGLENSFRLRVFDPAGLERKLETVQTPNGILVDLSAFPAGLYLAVMEQGERRWMGRFAKF